MQLIDSLGGRTGKTMLNSYGELEGSRVLTADGRSVLSSCGTAALAAGAASSTT